MFSFAVLGAGATSTANMLKLQVAMALVCTMQYMISVMAENRISFYKPYIAHVYSRPGVDYPFYVSNNWAT